MKRLFLCAVVFLCASFSMAYAYTEPEGIAIMKVQNRVKAELSSLGQSAQVKKVYKLTKKIATQAETYNSICGDRVGARFHKDDSCGKMLKELRQTYMDLMGNVKNILPELIRRLDEAAQSSAAIFVSHVDSNLTPAQLYEQLMERETSDEVPGNEEEAAVEIEDFDRFLDTGSDILEESGFGDFMASMQALIGPDTMADRPEIVSSAYMFLNFHSASQRVKKFLNSLEQRYEMLRWSEDYGRLAGSITPDVQRVAKLLSDYFNMPRIKIKSVRSSGRPAAYRKSTSRSRGISKRNLGYAPRR